MTRRGKIARLPQAIREELNQRLENGEQGGRLLEWLNGLPEVKKVLEVDFEGQPISDANLSAWRNGGFVDWQALQRAEAMMERWPLDCGLGIADGLPKPDADGFPSKERSLSQKACGLSENGSPTSKVQRPISAAPMVASLTNALTAHYAAALEDSNAIPEEDPKARVERLGRSLKDMSRLRRDELAAERLREHVRIEEVWVAIERQRAELERERLELQRATQARAANTQARGAITEADAERERQMHLEKAEMVKEMVREAKEADEKKRSIA